MILDGQISPGYGCPNTIQSRSHHENFQTKALKVALTAAGTPIGPNDTAIAGHAIAAGAP